MIQGITFGNQGPVMSGTWYNPATGDSFTVKDSFFENNQYMVQTTDGRLLGYDMIQNYVQSDKPIDMPKKNQVESLPSEVLNELADDIDMIPGDNIYPSKPLGSINKPIMEEGISNLGIIEKALKKYNKPEVDAHIKWSEFPKKQIEMLSEIMEIDMKEIVDWYTSTLDTSSIAIAIHNSIVEYINDQLYGRVEQETTPSPVVKEVKKTESSPKTKAKTTKKTKK